MDVSLEKLFQILGEERVRVYLLEEKVLVLENRIAELTQKQENTDNGD